MKKESFKKISAIALAAIMVATAMVMSSCSPSEAEKGVQTNAANGGKESNKVGGSNGAGENMDIIYSDEDREKGYILSGDTLTILNDRAMKDYHGYDDSPWYDNSQDIKKIIIKDGVTRIGRHAFNSSCVESITIPDGVTYIGELAFVSCAELVSVKMPNSVTSIGKSAFASCEKLAEVEISNGISVIEEDTFRYCTSLTSIVIPDGVVTIGREAFYQCSKLSCVEIPASVTRLEGASFGDCPKLETVDFKGTADQWGKIKKSAWDNHSPNITTIKVADSIYSFDQLQKGYAIIGQKLVILKDGKLAYTPFYEQAEITELTIGDGVTEIQGCKKLKITSVVIPKSVKVIDDSAFYGSSQLISVEMTNSVKEIRNFAFGYCESLKKIIFKGTQAEWEAIKKDNEWDKGTTDYVVVFEN